jgi:hypothetical protein
MGSKQCDVCGEIQGASPRAQAWQPPANAMPASELTSPAASWATGAARPRAAAWDAATEAQVKKARRRLGAAWVLAALVGGLTCLVH